MAERFEEAGFKVIIGFEAATALILNRMSPGTLGVTLFQERLLSFSVVQAEQTEATARAVAEQSGQPVVIIYDRTWLDGQAYTDPDDWAKLVESYDPFGRTGPEQWGIIHLVTAALGAEDFYTLSNNLARFETPEQARYRDERLVDAYQRFEHRFRIGNEAGFARKVHRAIEAACRFVGIPEPLEIERWFEVDSFDEAALAACRPVNVEIFQFYTPDEKRYRRRRLPDGSLTFSLTRKELLPGDDPSVRIEVSEMLTASAFGQARERYPDAPYVQKVRSVFDCRRYRWELDRSHKPTGRIKLEVETPTQGEEVAPPDFIKVKREVTGHSRWSNASLATLP